MPTVTSEFATIMGPGLARAMGVAYKLRPMTQEEMWDAWVLSTTTATFDEYAATNPRIRVEIDEPYKAPPVFVHVPESR